MKRNADGTFRNSRRPIIFSEAAQRDRWVEAEAIHLKRMGFSYEAIAEQITRVGRGQAKALTSMPEKLTFSPDYRITRQACHKACQKALARQPALEVEELRKLFSERCEDMYLNLQPGIRKGEPRAVEGGTKVLTLTARINGVLPPQRLEVAANKEAKATICELLQEVGPLGEEDDESDDGGNTSAA